MGGTLDTLCTQTPVVGGQALAAEQPVLRVVDVRKAFGDTEAVKGVSLAVNRGEILAILGPSGCGKTTTLRMVAGLELPDAGSIEIAGSDATSDPPYRRDVGMVFQSYALFPHLTVANNVAFGCRSRNLSRAVTKERVERYLNVVQIEALANRKPGELSGGQQQRVALARALAVEPAILLLDEPLAALDRFLREQMQVELRSLITGLGMTAMIVTHDQHEAMSLADKVAVMNGGQIEQIDTSRQLYTAPASRFVAEFVGASNLLSSRSVSQSADGHVYDCGAVSIRCENAGQDDRSPECDFLIRPEHVRIIGSASGSTEVANEADVTIDAVSYLGFGSRWYGNLSDGTRVEGLCADVGAVPESGDRVRVQMPAEHVVALTAGGTEAAS